MISIRRLFVAGLGGALLVLLRLFLFGRGLVFVFFNHFDWRILVLERIGGGFNNSTQFNPIASSLLQPGQPSISSQQLHWFTMRMNLNLNASDSALFGNFKRL